MAGNFASTPDRVTRVLTVGTVPHQLLDHNGNVLEATPGSGLLEENECKALEKKGIEVFSFFPSHFKRTDPNIESLIMGQRSPVNLHHDIPIFTSTSCSSFRFDQFGKEHFIFYVRMLTNSLNRFINRIEERHGPIDIVHVAHIFTNVLAMARINQTRIIEGGNKLPVVAHAHGTALKFLERETLMMGLGAHIFMGGIQPPAPYNLQLPRTVYDYLEQNYGEALGTEDFQGLPFLEKITQPMLAGFMNLIAPALVVVGQVIAISPKVREDFLELFPDFLPDNVPYIPNGYDPKVFYPQALNQEKVLMELKTSNGQHIPRSDWNAEHVIVFASKFVEWKNLKSLLIAAQQYEEHFAAKGETIVTIIVGTGTKAQVAKHEGLASSLNLRHAYFTGQLSQADMAKINNIAKMGVYPSTEEPFGMVAIECMACGKPVIVGTGGFKYFVEEPWGRIVDEPHNPERLKEAIIEGIERNWVTTKGPIALEKSQPFQWPRIVDKTIEKAYLPAITRANQYKIERIGRVGLSQLTGRMEQLKLSPARVKKHLLTRVPDPTSHDALVAAELVRATLMHGRMDTVTAIEKVVNKIESSQDLFYRR